MIRSCSSGFEIWMFVKPMDLNSAFKAASVSMSDTYIYLRIMDAFSNIVTSEY